MSKQKELPRVLIIEDTEAIQRSLAFGLKKDAEILQATTLKEAKELLLWCKNGKKDISVIILDGCIQSGARFNTLPILKRIFDDGFCGRVIAASGNEMNNEMMVACNPLQVITSDRKEKTLELALNYLARLYRKSNQSCAS